MDKAEIRSLIDILELAQQYIGHSSTNQRVQEILVQAHSVYQKNYENWTEQSPNSRFKDFQTFIIEGRSSDLQPLIDYLWKLYYKEEQEEVKKEVKEESTIPSNLEDLIYQYKEAQTNQIEVDHSSHSVVEAVKRARQTWDRNHRIQTILANRKQLESETTRADQLLVSIVDPKSQDKATLLAPLTTLAEQAVIAQNQALGGKTLSDAQKQQAVQDIVNIALSGTVDIHNLNNLNIISQLALLNVGVYADPQLAQINSGASQEIDSLNQNQFSDEPDKAADRLDKYRQDNQEEIETHSEETANKFIHQLQSNNRDLDLDLDKSKKQNRLILDRLSSTISNPTDRLQAPTPLDLHANELEAAIRKADPSLAINSTGIASRAEAVLKTTNVNDRNFNPTIVDLYGKGLTSEKLASLETYAQNHPNSDIGKLFSKQPDIFKQVRFQLSKLQQTKLGQEIKTDISKIKPLGSIQRSITSIYNKIPAPLTKSVKAIFNPVGTINSWINSKVGQYVGQQLIKNTNSVLVRKLGEYLLENGLKEGVKKFASSLFSKAATQVAVKAGTAVATEGAVAAISAALGISTGGLSLVIEAAIFLGWQAISSGWNTLKKITKKIYGEEIDLKQLAAFAGFLALGAASAVGTVAGTVVAGIKSVQVAVFSVIQTIIIAITLAIMYFTFSFLTAVIISTFVQLDSVEKVNYIVSYAGPINCSNMRWPFDGTFVITQGPNVATCTHHGGNAQSADFGTPLGTPIKSMIDGNVVLAQSGSTGYGNHVIIQAQTDSGQSFQIIYGHFSHLSVSIGATVKAGQVIGLSGSTGYSTGPHLHVGYIGIDYNSCPAGGFKINEGCCNGVTTTCNQP